MHRFRVAPSTADVGIDWHRCQSEVLLGDGVSCPRDRLASSAQLFVEARAGATVLERWKATRMGNPVTEIACPVVPERTVLGLASTLISLATASESPTRREFRALVQELGSTEIR